MSGRLTVSRARAAAQQALAGLVDSTKACGARSRVKLISCLPETACRSAPARVDRRPDGAQSVSGLPRTPAPHAPSIVTPSAFASRIWPVHAQDERRRRQRDERLLVQPSLGLERGEQLGRAAGR